MKLQSVLVISDHKDKAQKALARAKLMVEQQHCRLHVVAFCYERLDGLATTLDKLQRQHVKEKILNAEQQRLEKQLIAQGLKEHATCQAVWEKDITAWLDERSHHHHYDLVIKTTQRSGPDNRLQQDWPLLRNRRIPVLLVAEKRWRHRQSIMVSLDMATRSKAKQQLNHTLLDAGLMMAEAMAMPLHICYSVPVSVVLKDLGIIDSRNAVNQARKKYLPVIHAMLGDHPLPDNQIHFKAGETDKVIPSIAAQTGAGLVIMGSVGRQGLKAKVLGNTAEKVLTLLKTNIMVLQPQE